MADFINDVEAKLRGEFNSGIGDLTTSYDFPVLVIDRQQILPVLRFLYETEGCSFQFLTDLCAVHYPADKTIAVVYHLHNLGKNWRLRLKVMLPEGEPSIASATSLFACAAWMERETYDFFGVDFKGHPDLRRILNVDDMKYFPMRKEYPLEDSTRDDKNDAMFGR